MTYDMSGSGFDDATSDMQLQLGGEERERDALHTEITPTTGTAPTSLLFVPDVMPLSCLYLRPAGTP